MTPNPLTLASASPRRLALLAQIGIVPTEIVAPEIDEAPRPAEAPRIYARRMATEKLAAVPNPGFVIAADTVVAAGARILPKTMDDEAAEICLRRLSGRRHDVLTAVAIRDPAEKIVVRVVASVVGFARLDEGQIRDYLASGEWHGKAGGYAIQGRAAAFIDFLSGSYSGVVGLPLHQTANMLRGLGYKV
jgi:septum formation protein